MLKKIVRDTLNRLTIEEAMYLYEEHGICTICEDGQAVRFEFE